MARTKPWSGRRCCGCQLQHQSNENRRIDSLSPRYVANFRTYFNVFQKDTFETWNVTQKNTRPKGTKVYQGIALESMFDWA